MNKFLASSIAVFNQLLAVVLVFIGMILGNDSVLGGVLGFIAAIVICGALALLIDIRNELIHIRRELQYREAT